MRDNSWVVEVLGDGTSARHQRFLVGADDAAQMQSPRTSTTHNCLIETPSIRSPLVSN